jgi:hypothetical protein
MLSDITISLIGAAGTEIRQVAHVVDGLWSLNTDSVEPTILGYDRLIAIGDIGWRDYEVTVPITVHALEPSGYQSPDVNWPQPHPPDFIITTVFLLFDCLTNQLYG